MSDMTPVIVPKSDQINADDLLTGPITIEIVDVIVKGGEQQPVNIAFLGNDKFFRPCKSMCRVLVALWGNDSSQYKGKSLTLYNDTSIQFGGVPTGGVRISHASHIEKPITFMLTISKSKRKPCVVLPLEKQLEQKQTVKEQTQTAMPDDLAKQLVETFRTQAAKSKTFDELKKWWIPTWTQLKVNKKQQAEARFIYEKRKLVLEATQ